MKSVEPAEELTIHYNSFRGSIQTKDTIKAAFKNSHAIVWVKQGHGKYTVD